MQTVNVYADRCSRIRHKLSACALCESNCPAGAIKVGEVGSNIKIDWQRCTRCGICINLCPVGVFGLRETTYRTLLKNLTDNIADNKLHIACHNSQLECPKIECMGILGVADILHLYTNGAQKLTLSYASDCETCQNRYGVALLNDELTELENIAPHFELLAGMQITHATGETTIKFTEKFPSEAQTKQQNKDVLPVSRRRLFAQAYKDAATAVVKGATPFVPQVSEGRTVFSTQKEVPIKRQIFLEALAKCGQVIKREIKTGAYFYSQTIADTCTLCKVCTRFCTTGALHLNDDETALVFNASKCVSCGMCVTACYHHFIKTSKTTDLGTFWLKLETKRKPH
ncbi:hypothetical protein AGMMS49941_08810 [Deferribacterales bacterium]|nr:hypothetical protein AGMMS49941_08810 [Deferribacterales bacterium]